MAKCNLFTLHNTVLKIGVTALKPKNKLDGFGTNGYRANGEYFGGWETM